MANIGIRSEAKARGDLKYFTGKPCKNGHVCERYVRDAGCLECGKMRKENNKEYYREWRKNNREYAKEYNKNYYQENKSYINEQNNKWYKENSEYASKRQKEWRKLNADKVSATNAERRAVKISQTCSCCAKEDFDRIYREAQEKGYEVDHIEPLRLGGLHCLSNLQILSVEDHKEKTKKDIAKIAKHKQKECLENISQIDLGGTWNEIIERAANRG